MNNETKDTVKVTQLYLSPVYCQNVNINTMEDTVAAEDNGLKLVLGLVGWSVNCNQRYEAKRVN